MKFFSSLKKAVIVFNLVLLATLSIAQVSNRILEASPEIFMPGVISTGMNERDLTISPDGNDIYFTVTTPNQSYSAIFFIEKRGNEWTKPKVAPFSGEYQDLEPMFSPDGNDLYFASKRPDQDGNALNADIFVTHKTASGWSEPKRLSFNTPMDEYYPSVNEKGDVFFTGVYDMDKTGEDIYVCRKNGNEFLPPQKLHESVNSVFHEFNAYVDPKEAFILFTRYGQKTDKGGGDLYVSFQFEREWTEAIAIESANSPGLDYCPFVDNSHTYLYFTSRRSTVFDPEIKETDLYENLKNISQSPGNNQGDIYRMKLPFTINK